MNADDLVFEPVSRHTSCGNEIQVAQTSYRGINITERTFFPWSPFKDVSTCYVVDIIFPMGAMDCVVDYYYTEEGFGVPQVNTLEEAVAIIDKFKDSNQ